MYVEGLRSNCLQRLDGEIGTDVPRTQVNDTDERFILCDDQRSKVAVVRQDNAAIGIRYAQHSPVALPEQPFFRNGADVVPLCRR